mmetsp:Transcript_27826/g.80709  ORF Transcript_27826/g.80709 Transcript_27826/m.80709 type:complete len:350 (+) Transcript_27826:38-1087(+)
MMARCWAPDRCRSTVFRFSFLVALPNAMLSALLFVTFPNGSMTMFGEEGGILTETIVWSGFTSLLGFLVVFRSSQSYARWCEGCTAVHQMRAQWFEATATANAFISNCGASEDKVRSFKEVLVRVVSLLHALALAELEIGDHEEDSFTRTSHDYALINPEDLDPGTLREVSTSPCKVELVYGWLQHLVMDYYNQAPCLPNDGEGMHATRTPRSVRRLRSMGSIVSESGHRRDSGYRGSMSTDETGAFDSEAFGKSENDTTAVMEKGRTISRELCTTADSSRAGAGAFHTHPTSSMPRGDSASLHAGHGPLKSDSCGAHLPDGFAVVAAGTLEEPSASCIKSRRRWGASG